MHSNVEVDTADGSSRPDRPRRLQKRIALGLVPLLIAGGVAAKLTATPEASPAPPPPLVSVATPLVRDIAEWDDYVGRFSPSRTVDVKPRVSGEVTGVYFRDGDFVRAGQLLFTIDPRPFTAALAEAQAGAASARSALALARTELQRANRLIGDEAVAQSEVDELRAKVQAAQAALAAADARVRARALDVEFTRIRAPISGRVSDRRIDAGNQVSGGEGGSGTLLTTVNALDPIYFNFDASEGLFLKTLRNRTAGSPAPEVQIRLQDESDYRWSGRLDFTDNGLDPRSGTIRGRAILANPGRFLTPGMFGNMRLASGGRSRALLVPDEAVQTDQARKILLVVNNKGAVAAKPVELGPVVDGLRVIRSGLTPHDRVIVSGSQSAMPGSVVRLKPIRIAAEPTPAPPATPEAIVGEATLAR